MIICTPQGEQDRSAGTKFAFDGGKRGTTGEICVASQDKSAMEADTDEIGDAACEYLAKALPIRLFDPGPQYVSENTGLLKVLDAVDAELFDLAARQFVMRP